MRGSSQQMFVLLGELDLTMTQMKTLGMLEDCVEQVSVKELSERLGLSLPATSRTVDGLLRRGLLSRLEDDRGPPHQARARSPTTAARWSHRIVTARLQGLEAYATTLSDDQRAALLAALADLPAQAEGPRMTDRIRLNEDNRRWWTLAAMCFALFMVMLDNTVVNVALPSIQRDLARGLRSGVDGQRLHAGLRRPAGHRRAPGRPLRAPAHVPLRRRRRSRRRARSSASPRATPGWSRAARSRASAPRS